MSPHVEEPDDEALRNGAQLYDGAGRPDPRLVAAERVIMQLRTLLGALTIQSGGRLTVTREQLLDPQARTVHIDNGLDQVALHVPTDAPPPGDEPGPVVTAREPGGQRTARHSSLLRRIDEIRAAHAPQDGYDETGPDAEERHEHVDDAAAP